MNSTERTTAVDRDALVMAGEVSDALQAMRRAGEALERARAIAASYHAVALALSCACARDQLEEIAATIDAAGRIGR